MSSTDRYGSGSPSWRISAHPHAEAINRRNEFEAAASRAGAPDRFYCPMSHRLLQEPVTISTGCVLERRYLERWIELGQTTCPTTGQELSIPITFELDTALREEIEKWCLENVHLPAVATPDAQATITAFNIEPGHEKSRDLNGNFASDDFVLAMALQEEELDMYTTKTRLPRIRTRNGSSPATLRESPALSSPEYRSRRGNSFFILAIISAAYIALFILALWKSNWKLESINANPLVGPNRASLSNMGSLVNSKVRDNHQWWRIVSSIFVSSGVIQLFCSLVCVWTLVMHLQRSSRIWRPSLSVPALFLLSSLTGAVVAVNLAYDQDSCGSSAGVSALLGAVWMEQLTCWRELRGRFVTLLILVLLAGVFAFLSLLPLVGMWYTGTAFLCGALLLPLITYPPNGNRGRGKQHLKWAVRVVLLTIVIAILALGIVSILVDQSKTAQKCPFCLEANCVEIRSWWDCDATAETSVACGFTANRNGTTTIRCPTGGSQLVNTGSLGNRTTACNQACARIAALDLSSLSPASAGVLI